MPWTIGAYCCAFAYATELSLSTFSARAALIGGARFAFTSDIVGRSGSVSIHCRSSSTASRPPYVCRSQLDTCFHLLLDTWTIQDETLMSNHEKAKLQVRHRCLQVLRPSATASQAPSSRRPRASS